MRDLKIISYIVVIGIFLLAVLAMFLIVQPAFGYNLPTKEFQLGDDLSPYPNYGNCNDAVIYSVVYLESMGYDTEIMYGKVSYMPANSIPHVWLEVEGWIYDMGIAHQEFDSYKGKEITYRQLLGSAMLD